MASRSATRSNGRWIRYAALATAAHPLIRFQQGALGRRRALVVGTRLYVYQVISTLRGNHGDVDQTAEDFGLALQLCRRAAHTLDEQRRRLHGHVRSWAVQGQQNAGLIFTSDASLPRTHATIGKFVKLLDALLHAHPKPDEFVDRIHWL